MCGRFTFQATWAEIHAWSGLATLATPETPPDPAWNIAPTDPLWVVTTDGDGEPAVQAMRWGLVPSWAKDRRIGASMINARVETAREKPAFRAAWKSRRCLVPASGYYEWRVEDGVKQPYWIHPRAQPVLMFAGLWEVWKQPDGRWLHTATILTEPADGAMLELHDRRPLMLGRDDAPRWLMGDADAAAQLAAAHAMPDLAWHPVSRAVGNVRNQGAQLVEPLHGQQQGGAA